MKYITSTFVLALVLSVLSVAQNRGTRTSNITAYRANVGTSQATFVFPLKPGQRYKWSNGGLTFEWMIAVNNNRTNYEFGFSLFTPMGATPEESGDIQSLLQAGQCSIWKLSGNRSASVVNGATLECFVSENQRSLTVRLSGSDSIKLLFSGRPSFITFRTKSGLFVKPSSARIPVKYS